MALEFQIMLYIFLVLLILVFIILGIKMIQTLNKLDQVIDNVNGKMQKLEGFFDVVDSTTELVSNINNKFVTVTSAVVKKIFGNKNGKKEDEI